jgi:hypothetical protein
MKLLYSGTQWTVAASRTGAPDLVLSATASVTAGTAYQVCAERAGATVRLYVNGAVVATGSLSGALYNSPERVYVGCGIAGGVLQEFFPGTVGGYRYTVGTARYNGAYTPPVLPFPTS